MDSASFDRLARAVGGDASRRGVLRSAFAAAAVGLGITSLLSPAETEAAKSCQKKCKKKKSNAARKKCKKKCAQQDQGGNGGQGGNQGQGKAAGTLCDTTGECGAPNICDIPVNDSGGDKRCCAPTGAPCGLKDPDNDDDTAPFCCRGNTCSSTTTTQGTCQPDPQE